MGTKVRESFGISTNRFAISVIVALLALSMLSVTHFSYIPSASACIPNGQGGCLQCNQTIVFDDNPVVGRINGYSNTQTETSGLVNCGNKGSIQITASADSGYRFTFWSVSGGSVQSSTSNPTTLTFTYSGGDTTVTANYDAKTLVFLGTGGSSVWEKALNDIKANPSSFSAVSPFLDNNGIGYTIYTSGSNLGGFDSSSTNTENIFGHSWDIAQIANQLETNQSVQVIPTIDAADQGSCTYDSAMQNLLSSSSNEKSFITSGVNEARSDHYGGYVFDYEWASSSCGVTTTIANEYISFLNQFGQSLHSNGMILEVSVYPCMGNVTGICTYPYNPTSVLNYPNLASQSGVDFINIQAYTSSDTSFQNWVSGIHNSNYANSVPVSKMSIVLGAQGDSNNAWNNPIVIDNEEYMISNGYPQMSVFSEWGYFLPVYNNMESGTTWETQLSDSNSGISG